MAFAERPRSRHSLGVPAWPWRADGRPDDPPALRSGAEASRRRFPRVPDGSARAAVSMDGQVERRPARASETRRASAASEAIDASACVPQFAAQLGELVAQPGGVLEAQVGGRLVHLLLESLDQPGELLLR